jgi:glutamate synthase (ferredoxin)
VLIAIGCDMARQCHLNTCPTGIATQKPELRAKFRGKPEHIVRFFTELAEDLRHLLSHHGLRTIGEAIGRTDLLDQVRFDGHLDLGPMLSASPDGTRKWAGILNTQPVEELPLDEAWVEPALAAILSGQPYAVEGEIAVLRAQADVPVEVTMRLHGTAGQSFGAFLVEGMRLELDGQANDFVGKGLSGGEIVIRARGNAARNSGQHVILGNVALYGATAGRLFAAGRGGERFAVRNSGVRAVIEGVGDHGCEYMTGGLVVVLGRAGINFAAGMTGGLAWVYDDDGSFVAERRFHTDFVEVEWFADCDGEAQAALREVIAGHAEIACSGLARAMLAAWDGASSGFVRLTPKPQV